jgi:PKD repeat protein
MSLKRFALTTIITSLFFTLLMPVSAHRGGVPILKINGELVKIYFDTNFQDSVFDLAYDADKAPQNYVINQQLDFEIDLSKFPVPVEVLEKSTIIWDFGDGTGDKGANKSKITHTYTKTGTFTLQIWADPSTAGINDMEIQPLQVAVINILPDNNYRLPEAVIKINGQIASGLTKSVMEATSSATPSSVLRPKSFEVDLNNTLTFDASDSKPGTAKIKRYRWSLGQGEEGNNIVESYRYKLPQYYISAVLRVEDENGYFSDTFVNIENSGLNEENNPDFDNAVKFLLIMGGAMLTVAILGIVGFKLFKKKGHK